MISIHKENKEYLLNFKGEIFCLTIYNERAVIETYYPPKGANAPIGTANAIKTAIYNKDQEKYYKLFNSKLNKRTLDKILKDWAN